MVGPDYRARRCRRAGGVPLRAEGRRRRPRTPQWWKQFDDPVLDGYIAEALAHNLNVQVAVANVEQAAGVLTQTRSPLFPQVGYQADGTRQRYSELVRSQQLAAAVGGNPQTTYQVLARRELGDRPVGPHPPTDRSGAREPARHRRSAARRRSCRSSPRSPSTYLQLRGLDEQLVVAKRTLGAYGESVQLFELQFKYGQVSQMNVAQAQSQYETAAAQIPADRDRRSRRPRTRSSILLGRNPGPIPRGKSIDELALPSVPAGVPSQLLERRPDLLQAEQTLIAANAQIGAAKALYFPTISLTGAFGTASNDLYNLFNGPVAGVELRRVDRRPDLHRSARSAARSRRPRPRRRRRSRTTTSSSIQNAFARRRERARREPEAAARSSRRRSGW